MHQIKIPIGCENEMDDESFIQFCKHFSCIAVKVIRDNEWLIRSDDAINFFWLGANINFESESTLSQSIASKFKNNGVR